MTSNAESRTNLVSAPSRHLFFLSPSPSPLSPPPPLSSPSPTPSPPFVLTISLPPRLRLTPLAFALHQIITTIWTGNVCDPAALLAFICILQNIRDQQNERHELIGNWLYCLRDLTSAPANVAKGKGKKKTRDQQGAGRTATKRPRAGGDVGDMEGGGAKRTNVAKDGQVHTPGQEKNLFFSLELHHGCIPKIDRANMTEAWASSSGSSFSYGSAPVEITL